MRQTARGHPGVAHPIRVAECADLRFCARGRRNAPKAQSSAHAPNYACVLECTQLRDRAGIGLLRPARRRVFATAAALDSQSGRDIAGRSGDTHSLAHLSSECARLRRVLEPAQARRGAESGRRTLEGALRARFAHWNSGCAALGVRARRAKARPIGNRGAYCAN